MDETVQFLDAEKKFKISVLKEFTLKVPDYEKLPLIVLLHKHQMGTFLHNTKGLAIEYVGEKAKEVQYNDYRIKGKRLTLEEGRKLEHNAKFADKVEHILDTNE